MSNHDAGMTPVPRTPGSAPGHRAGTAPKRAAAPARPDQAQDMPDSAAALLQNLADRAMEYPPKDIHVLAASVQKFLLTNLEPALRMAKQIREDMDSQAAASLEVLADDRQNQAIALLAG